ncbi:MAG: hypothetical protein AMXMBFR13_35870 [Phycisphaerae bacterium]
MEVHRDFAPPNLYVLTLGGRRAYLPAQQLLCPVSQFPYIYVTGWPFSCKPADIIAYEPLWYHHGQGGNVLRADGSVRWYSADAYPQILAEAEAYRVVPATWPSPPESRS